MNKFFHQLDPNGIRYKLVLLDVDGTIAADHNEDIAGEVLDMIRKIEQQNQVVLLSNNRSKGRIERISRTTQLEYLKTKYKKPNKKILKAIDPEKRKDILVIGDKLLTDMIFARRIRASYIKTRRLKSPKDRWFVRVSYYFDDLLFLIFKKFF